MTYRGQVRNGVVVFDGDVLPPEGLAVEVVAVTSNKTDDHEPSIWKKLAALSGTAPDLPKDAARNHDHYLYGSDKR